MPENCVYFKKPFIPSTREHILQACLGARWKSSGFCSSEANALFAGIDKALADTVHEFRVLLGADGDHGSAPDLKNIPDAEGRQYTVASGGDFSLTKPFVKVEPHEDPGSARIHAELRDVNQIEWAAAEVFKQASALVPGIQLSREDFARYIREQSTISQTAVDSPLHFQVKMGGIEALRAITKSAFNLLGVKAPEIALRECFDPVRDFILHGTGIMEDFIRWGTEPPILTTRIGPVDHLLAVWSDEKGVWAHCQLYSAIIHPIRLSSTPIPEELAFCYLVDPLRSVSPSENRDAIFSPSCLQTFDAAEKLPGKAIWGAMIQRVHPLITLAQQLMIWRDFDKFFAKLLSQKCPGLPALLKEELHRRFGQYFASQLGIPSRPF